MMGGFQKTALVHPRGVNHNDKTVMINPPGRTWRGVNENFSPAGRCQLHTVNEFPAKSCEIKENCVCRGEGVRVRVRQCKNLFSLCPDVP